MSHSHNTISTFIAFDAAGRRHTLYVVTPIERFEVYQKAARMLPGTPSIRTSRNEIVNEPEPGRFVVLGTGEVLTAADPRQKSPAALPPRLAGPSRLRPIGVTRKPLTR